MTEVLVRIAREATWAPIAVITLHWLVGGWLGHEPFVDPVMHFLGGVAAAYFFWRTAACARRYLGEPSTLALALLACGLAVTAAVCWEFGEFLSDALRGTRVQRDLANTMRDLFFGMSGAAIYVVTHGLALRQRDGS